MDNDFFHDVHLPIVPPGSIQDTTINDTMATILNVNELSFDVIIYKHTFEISNLIYFERNLRQTK